MKFSMKFFNKSKDSTQFWLQHNQIFGRKLSNIAVPIYDTESGLHVFDDQEISEKLKKFNIENTGKNKFDLEFTNEIEK